MTDRIEWTEGRTLAIRQLWILAVFLFVAIFGLRLVGLL